MCIHVSQSKYRPLFCAFWACFVICSLFLINLFDVNINKKIFFSFYSYADMDYVLVVMSFNHNDRKF